MKLTFYGAAGEVTGSKYLLEVGDSKILLDCGMFQGRRALTREKNKELQFAATNISAVVLSHGHFDHCGLLPLLVKEGFKGRIFASPATIDVAYWIMRDAAYLQMQDALYMNRHKIEGAELAEPLYTIDDVEKTMKLFTPVNYARVSPVWTKIAPNVNIKFYDAGHILGSAITVLNLKENERIVNLVFSGDVGQTNTPLLPDPEIPTEAADVLILESTYGGRNHGTISEAKNVLIAIIKQAINKRSKIIVPAFALGRTQELIYILHEIFRDNKDLYLPVYLDSPLAAELTQVFIKHEDCFDATARQEFLNKGTNPLLFNNLHTVASVEESKALNIMAGPLIVISSSGMCEGGRILHHLKNGVSNPNNFILITGFQAEHTLGRRLVEGAREVKIFNEIFEVRAQVKVLNELSAHADQTQLLNFALSCKGLTKIYLVHGEAKQAEELKLILENNLNNVEVVVAQSGQSVVL